MLAENGFGSEGKVELFFFDSSAVITKAGIRACFDKTDDCSDI